MLTLSPCARQGVSETKLLFPLYIICKMKSGLMLGTMLLALMLCMGYFVPYCDELHEYLDDDIHHAGVVPIHSRSVNAIDGTKSGITLVHLWDLLSDDSCFTSTIQKKEPSCTRAANNRVAKYCCTRSAHVETKNVRDRKTKRVSASNKNAGTIETKEEKPNTHYCADKCRMSDRIQSGRFMSSACRILRVSGLLPLGKSVPENTSQESGARRSRVLSGGRSLKYLTVPWCTKYSNYNLQTMRYLRNCTCTLCEAVSPVNSSVLSRNKAVASTCECKSGSESDEGDEGTTIVRESLYSLVMIMGCLKNISWLLVHKSARRTVHRLGKILLDVSHDTALAADTEKGSMNMDSFHLYDDALKDEKCGLSDRVSPPFLAYYHWKRFLPLGVFTNLWVAPVPRFLPSVFSHESNHLDHEGYRLASLAALPTSCTLSRVRLAAAGFHFDPRKDINAVVCHKCGTSLSLGYSSQECTPLSYHHQASPNCQFLKDMLDVFTDAPASLSSMNTDNTQTSQCHTGSFPRSALPRRDAASVNESPMEPSSMEPGSMSSMSSSLASSSLSPPSLGSTDSSLNTSSHRSASSLSPSSLSSARTSLTTSSHSSRSSPSMNSNTESSLWTSDLGSFSSMSLSSESSISASAVSGFTCSPTMLTGTFGATASSIGMAVTAGIDHTDSTSDLMTDDAEASPETTQAPWESRARQAGHQQATATRIGYFLALPSTAQDVPSASVFPRRDSPTMVQGSNPRADDSPTHTLDITCAVYPQFGTTHSRLATFTNWPQALARLFPASFMVTIGFYYAGYADCVRCFYCGVGLKTWYEEDDALVEHIRWRPNCQYILATKGKQFVQDTLARINNPPATNSHAHAPRSSSAVPVMQTISSQSNPQAGQETNRSGSPRPVQNQTPQQPPRAPSQSETVSRAPRQGDPATIDNLQNMGFSTEAISRAMAQILAWGRPPSLQNMLDLLLGGHD